MFPASCAFCDFILFLVDFLSIILCLAVNLFRSYQVLSVLGTEQLGPFGDRDASPAPSFRDAEILEFLKSCFC